MKVLFDHQTFTLQEFGGISRYFFEINKYFRLSGEVETSCSVFLSNNDYIKDGSVFQPTPFFSNRKFKGKLRAMLAINKMVSTRAYRKSDFDIFHPTYYDPYYLTFQRKKPVVVTCLDLIHEKYIQDDIGTLRNKDKSLKSADMVVAISHNTKNDLMEYYQIPSERISVTHLASSFPILDQEPTPEPSYPFFLYVGMRNLYKNFATFVRALAPLVKSEKDLYLHFAGGGPFDDNEKKFMNEIGILEKVKYFPGSDASLRDHYSRALAFFYPSLYEGFGIPVLEAMACGCPVAASKSSSLPEVGGDAAMYFDPGNTESILSVADTLYRNGGIRAEMRLKGFSRAKEFSWARTARETLNIYRTIK